MGHRRSPASGAGLDIDRLGPQERSDRAAGSRRSGASQLRCADEGTDTGRQLEQIACLGGVLAAKDSQLLGGGDRGIWVPPDAKRTLGCCAPRTTSEESPPKMIAMTTDDIMSLARSVYEAPKGETRRRSGSPQTVPVNTEAADQTRWSATFAYARRRGKRPYLAAGVHDYRAPSGLKPDIIVGHESALCSRPGAALLTTPSRLEPRETACAPAPVTRSGWIPDGRLSPQMCQGLMHVPR